MTAIQFLAEWALRSSILILSGALLLWVLRVKDPSVRLAAWTAMLFGSLAIPAISGALPKVPLAVMRATRPAEVPVAVYQAAPLAEPAVSGPYAGVANPSAGSSGHFDWTRAVLMLYLLVAGALLLRLCFGLAMSFRLLDRSRATGQATEGIEIRESDQVATPAAMGIARPAIVLPIDWRQWDATKLDAVLAHERSHIQRHDLTVQLLSAIHRALLWHSPLSWFLHRTIVRVAEDASDDAAVAATRDRVSYAEVLLEFMQRGVRGTSWQGVPMARYGRPEERIHRILDAPALSRGVTRWSVAAILVLGAPLAYVVAAARPERAPQAQAMVAPASVSAKAQSPAIAAVRPAFEVASIKPNNSPGENRVQFGPDTLTIVHLPLANILIQAYDLPTEQMSFGVFNLLFQQRYDIVAKAAGRVRRDQMKLMLQTLLADRFHLAVHLEQKLVPGYALLVDKDGPRLQAPASPDEEADFDKRIDGKALRQTIEFKNATMQLLAQILMETADMSKLRPGPSPVIVNMTGIKGGFDFTLAWTREEAAAGDTDPPEKLLALIAGLHKLGLTVKSQTVPMDILVIDHMEKTPTAN